MHRVSLWFVCLIVMGGTANAEKQTVASIQNRVRATVKRINQDAANRRFTQMEVRTRVSNKLFDQGFVAGYIHATPKLMGHSAHPNSPFAKETRFVPAAQAKRMDKVWNGLSQANGWDCKDNPYLLGFEQGGRTAAYESYVNWLAKIHPMNNVPSFKTVFEGAPLRAAAVALGNK